MRGKYDVDIGKISPAGLPGSFVISDMVVVTRPTDPDEEKTEIRLEELNLDVGLFALLTGTTDVDLVAVVGGGTIEGNVRMSKAGLATRFETDSLPLGNVPGLAAALGLPMEGGLHAELALELPKNEWREADGYVKISCPSCTIGDGKSKVKPGSASKARGRRAMFTSEGITVPKLNLGNLSGEIDIVKGKGISRTSRPPRPTASCSSMARFCWPASSATRPCPRAFVSSCLTRSRCVSLTSATCKR